MRPCTCERFQEGQPYQKGQCRLCWLYHNDPRYKALWAREPGIFKKAANLVKSSVSHLKAGLPEVSDEVYQHRLATCSSCSLFNSENKTCKECGCKMEIKARWAEQDCPQGLWGNQE